MSEPACGLPCEQAVSVEDCTALCAATDGCFAFSVSDAFGAPLLGCTLHGLPDGTWDSVFGVSTYLLALQPLPPLESAIQLSRFDHLVGLTTLGENGSLTLRGLAYAVDPGSGAYACAPSTADCAVACLLIPSCTAFFFFVRIRCACGEPCLRLTPSRRLQANDDSSDVTANICPDPNTQRMCVPVTNVNNFCPSKNDSSDNTVFYMLPAILPSPSPPPPTPPPLIPPTPPRSSLPATIVALLEAVGLLACIMLRQRLLRRYRARDSEVKRLSLLEAGSDDLLREFQFDVFISYRREDFAMVDQIASYVREAAALPGCSEGLRVFKDRDGFMTGQPFDMCLMDALAASAVFCPSSP